MRFEKRSTRLEHVGFALVRTPLLPATVARPELSAATDALEARILEIEQLVAKSPLAEALEVASPSLVAALGESRPPDERRKIALALMRYLERCRERATPFGLCAGYTVIPVGGKQDGDERLTLAPQSEYLAALRVDVAAIGRWVHRRWSEMGDEDARRVRFTTSRALAHIKDSVRAHQHDGMMDVRCTSALAEALRCAREELSLGDLDRALVALLPQEPERKEFLERIVRADLLVLADLPAPNCSDELERLEVQERAAATSSVKSIVGNVRRRKTGPIDAELIETTRAVDRLLQVESLDNVGASERKACIVGLMKPLARGGISESLAGEAARVAGALARISTRFEDRRYRRFREHLLARYERREVPLIEALDPQSGFEFPVDPDLERLEDPSVAAWRLRIYSDALAHAKREIRLTHRDLPHPPQAPEIPPSLILCAQLRYSAGRMSLSLPSLDEPMCMLSRVCLFSDEARDYVRSFIDRLSAHDPHTDLADVRCYLPSDKSGVLVQYPSLTRQEIVLSPTYEASYGNAIPVDDLLVSATTRGIRLRSRRTGRAIRPMWVGGVVPFDSHMPSVVRFLFTVGNSPTRFAFDWEALRSAPFLPRVMLDDHILAPAQWDVPAADTMEARAAETPIDRWRAVQRLRNKLAWPRYVLVRRWTNDELDQERNPFLAVDLDDVLSVESWLEVGAKHMTVVEQFPYETSGVVGPEGQFQNELVMPLLRRGAAAPSVAPDEPTFAKEGEIWDAATTFDRVGPGGDCLYLVMHGDRTSLLSLITVALRDLIVDGIESHRISRWFFVPYIDPDPHLRVRIFGDQTYLWAQLLPEVNEVMAPLLAARTVTNVRIETYYRESVRYGGRAIMDLCEEVFCASSEAAIAFHDEVEIENAAVDEVVVPVAHSLWAMLLLAERQPQAVRDQAILAGTRYSRPEDVTPKRTASALLRAHRDALLSPVDPAAVFGEDLAQRFARALANVRAKALEEKCDYPVLLADLMHMHMIRLLTPWFHIADFEPTVYFLVAKALQSAIARAAPL